MWCAAITFGKINDDGALFVKNFPSVVIWHWIKHRLELSMFDEVNIVTGIYRFKAFIDKLYVVYRASPKGSKELQISAKLLDVELVQMRRILSIRWVASSVRSVKAIWTFYEAIFLSLPTVEPHRCVWYYECVRYHYLGHGPPSRTVHVYTHCFSGSVKLPYTLVEQKPTGYMRSSEW